MMKVSIITACRNSESTIEDALLSVQAQTYEHIEHIIVDGNSDDGTISVLEKHKNKISKMIREPDEGIYDALNKGIKISEGDIIAFLHADDIYYAKDSVSKIVEEFHETDADAVYGDLLYVNKHDTDKRIRKWISGDFHFRKLKYGWMPPHPALFIKKAVYDKYGDFDKTFRISADYDIILRFLGSRQIRVRYLPGIVLKMRVGGESNKSLKNIIRKMKEDVKALKKNKFGGLPTVLLKNVIKIPQLFLR
jgi:glycosyltransferase